MGGVGTGVESRLISVVHKEGFTTVTSAKRSSDLAATRYLKKNVL